MNDLKKKDRKVSKFKIYFYFLRAFQKKLSLFMFYSFCLSVTQALLIAALYPFVSFALDQGGSQQNVGVILEHVNKIISMSPIADPLFSASVLLILLGILQGIFRYLSVAASVNLSYDITHNLQKRMYEKVMNADISYFIRNKQGDILFQLKDPPLKVGYIIRGSAVFVKELLMALFLLVMMVSIDKKIALVVFSIAMFFGIVIKVVTQKIIYRTGVASTRALGEEDVVLSESLSGIYTIKAFLAEKKWTQTFVNRVAEFVRVTKKMTIMKEIPVAVLEAVVIILIAVSAIAFKMLYADSFIAFMPVFSVFAVAIFKMIPSLRNLSNAGMNIVSLFFNMELCYDMLHKEMATVKKDGKPFYKLKRSIDFKNVDFSYSPQSDSIFEDLSLSIKKNNITALVGKSGSGKTTLINLLLKFYEPGRGTIEVDGVDLSEIERTSWLERIGYVSQEPFIFHATIKENISFGKECPEEDVVEAAKLAGAHQFIMNLEKGYDTVVGERGMKLSGGEKQRIAIARAILRKPQIVIFDEATSALDAKTEKIVQETIKRISSSYTVILVAHRFSTVKIADKIMVFSEGKLLEEGTHEDLLKANNHYSQLYGLSFA